MSNHKNVFMRMATTKVLNQFANRLPVGTHDLIFLRYGIKESKKTNDPIVEADFLIEQSDTVKEGEVRGWAWFVSQPGWAGKYEEERAGNFVRAVGTCTGDERVETPEGVAELGGDLIDDSQPGRGLRIRAVVTAQTDKQGNPKTNDKGEIYTNVDWIAIEQTLEDVAEARSYVDENKIGMAKEETKSKPQGLAGARAAQAQKQETASAATAKPAGSKFLLRKQ